MRKRGVFSKFFHQENLQKIIPQMDDAIKSGFQKLRDENWGDKTTDFEWKKINMSDHLESILNEMVMTLLFAQKEQKYIEEVKMTTYIRRYIEIGSEATLRPFTFLTFGIFCTLGLDSYVRKSKAMFKILSEKVNLMYWERVELRKTVPCTDNKINILDMVVEDNKSLPHDKQWTDGEIAENLALIQFAGLDTIKNTFSTTVSYFSKNKKILKNLDEVLKNITREDYNTHEKLEEITLETLRLFSPIFTTTPRKFIKNCKIGGYKFRKGDFLVFPLSLKHHCDDLFLNSKVFDSERFSKTSKDQAGGPKNKIDFAPFGLGRRNCIGQYFAKFMLKSMLTHMFQMFEISDDADHSPKMVLKFIYGVDEAKIEMRPKNK